MTRELHHWKVDLHTQTGETKVEDFLTYWNPLESGAMEAVMMAAQCTATAKSAPFGQAKVQHTATRARLVVPEGEGE